LEWKLQIPCQENHNDCGEKSVSRTNSWRLTLVGIALLAATAASEAKVIVLGPSLTEPAANTAGALRRVARQPDDSGADYASGYQMLDLHGPMQNLPAAAQHDIRSFRELSDDSTLRDPRSHYASDSDGQSPSPTGTTDAGIALLIICGLAVYQLRRKHQLLKRLPFSP
jgi:hypothetical protein